MLNLREQILISCYLKLRFLIKKKAAEKLLLLINGMV